MVGEMLAKCGVQTQPADSYERLKNELQHVYQTRKFLVMLDDMRREALEIAKAALPMLIEVAGENHPVTLSFREFIAGLQSGAGEGYRKDEDGSRTDEKPATSSLPTLNHKIHPS